MDRPRRNREEVARLPHKVYNHHDAVTKEKFRLLLDHDFDTVLVTHGSNVLEDGLTAVETLVDDVASQ